MTTPAEMAQRYETYDLINLYTEIGQRAEAAATDPQATVVPPDQWNAVEYEDLGFGDDAIALGKRIAMRLLRELHQVLCGDDPKYAEEKDKLRKAGLSRDALIAAVAAVLTGPLGIGAAIAAAVAAIFVKHMLEPTWDETCKFWDEKMANM